MNEEKKLTLDPFLPPHSCIGSGESGNADGRGSYDGGSHNGGYDSDGVNIYAGDRGNGSDAGRDNVGDGEIAVGIEMLMMIPKMMVVMEIIIILMINLGM